MMDNRTGQTCDSCNSHIIAFKDDTGRIILECSYCGRKPEDIELPIRLEDDI